jgi:hypothetical protein
MRRLTAAVPGRKSAEALRLHASWEQAVPRLVLRVAWVLLEAGYLKRLASALLGGVLLPLALVADGEDGDCARLFARPVGDLVLADDEPA